MRLDYHRLLRGWIFAAAILVTLIPVIIAVWYIGPWLETRLFPVVSHTEVLHEEVVPEGVIAQLGFTKYRECGIEDVVWYSGPVLLNVERVNGPPDAWPTRTVGRQQSSRILVRGISTLDGTRAVVIHRCHFLWRTISEFYP